MAKSYIMKYPGWGNFVRADESIGGNPSNTTWNNCSVWHKLENAVKYAMIFKQENFILYEVWESKNEIKFIKINITENICPCCGAIKNDSNP